MDSLKINTGVKRIMINDGPGVIEFNPSDVQFAEKFYALLGEFQAKQEEYQKRAEDFDALVKEVDVNGIPVNFQVGLSLIREICEFMRGKIDVLFGAGASQAAFGDVLSLDAIEQFFVGITPFVQSARQERIAKYAQKPQGRVMR